jgi:hypothetical protein
MTQIDGKFLVHRYEAVIYIVNLLQESNCAFAGINFFDVTSASTSSAGKFANISAAAVG